MALASTLGDEPIVAEADFDRCREIQDNVFNFAKHREPQNYGLINRPKDAAEGGAEGGGDARANPKRGGETGQYQRPLILAVFFSLVVALQHPQQRPRQNYRQDEGHENGKGDRNYAHERLAMSPTNPKRRTTAPIAPATMTTYFS